MGQTQVQLKQNEDYILIQELPVGNIVKHNKTQTLHFLKQYSFTAQQAYQNALNTYSLKLVNKNQHILNFMHFTTKSQNTFCSTFHKIILIFQYLDYTLEKQISNRVKDNRPFNQKQMWSVLCSCVLASAHLIHCQGKMHCGLTPRDIRLSQNGCVKLLSHEMIGIDSSHSQNQGIPKTLALTLIQCIKLSKLSNQQNSYLQLIIQGLQCSRQMKDVLLMMIKKNIKFTQLQQHLFKLVQDDQSIASQSNTPILKSQNSISSNYKYHKNYQNQQILKYSKVLNHKFLQLQPNTNDLEDSLSSTYLMVPCQMQTQNPDQIEENINQDDNKQTQRQQQSRKQINTFLLKQKNQQKSIQLSYNISRDSKIINPTLINSQGYDQNSEQQMFKNKINQQKQQGIKQGIDINGSNLINKKQENLFTDPKLFSLIKNMEMNRSSVGEKNIYNKMQQSNVIINNNSNNVNNNNNNNNNNNVNNNIISNNNNIISNNNTNNVNNNYSSNNNINNNNNQHHQHFQSFSSNNFPNNYTSPQQIQSYPYLQSQQIKIQKQLPSSTNFKIQQQYTVNGLNQIQNVNYYEQIKTKKKNSIKQIQQIQKYEQKKYEDKNNVDQKLEYNKNYNILDNNDIGFKKKKQIPNKFENMKQNIILQQIKQKNQNTYKINKNQPDFHNNKKKSITINSNDLQNNANSHRPQQFVKQYGGYQGGQSARCKSLRENIHNNVKEQEKLVQVSEKYNRGRYEGTKLNGKRHGYGTFHYSEGGKYVGNWKFNKMHGKGVLYYPNNQIAYDGQWQNDQLSGYGTLFNEQVVNLQTPFDYSDWSNVQDYWVKYQGYFYQDNKEGNGKLYLVNGQRFQGQFHDDKVDGEGILYLNDGGSVKGRWNQNKLIRIF